jgi:hypothetical protein
MAQSRYWLLVACLTPPTRQEPGTNDHDRRRNPTKEVASAAAHQDGPPEFVDLDVVYER